MKRSIPELVKVLLCALVLALTSTPAFAHCRPENRVWGFSEKSAGFESYKCKSPCGIRGKPRLWPRSCIRDALGATIYGSLLLFASELMLPYNEYDED